MSTTQPKLKLYYFNIKGKGEAIRLLCAYAGLQLDDHRFDVADRTEFNQLKESGVLSFGQVPLLEVDDGKEKHHLVQSSAILRYLARLAGIYPSDDAFLAAKIDAITDQAADAFLGATVVTYAQRFGLELDGTTKAAASERIGKEITPRHLTHLENLLQRSKGWLASTDRPSQADFVWYVQLVHIMPERANFYPAELCKFDNYPKIKEFLHKFGELEAVKQYYSESKRQEIS